MDIVFDILSAASVPSARKTHLMYRGNLSYQQLGLYLNFVLERQLLEVKCSSSGNDCGPGNKTYALTEGGRKFLSLYRAMNDFLRELQSTSSEDEKQVSESGRKFVKRLL